MEGIIKRIVSALLLCIVVLNTAYGCGNAEKEYTEKLNQFNNTILLSAAECEALGNLTKKVWYNSIYEKADSETDKYTQNPNKPYEHRGETRYRFYGDFNQALSSLFSDPTTIETKESIQNSKKSIDEMYLELQNPPKGMEKQHEIAEILYDSYYALSSLVISPSGSLQDFSNAFKSADIDTITNYDKLRLFLSDDA